MSGNQPKEPQQQKEKQQQVNNQNHPEDLETTAITTLEALRRNLLSVEDLKSILRNFLKREDFAIEHHQLFSLSDKTEGFLGEHYGLTIRYKDKDGSKQHRFFLKLLNGTVNIIFQMVLSLNAYKKEQFFYEFLLRECEARKIDVSYSPEGYFSKPYLLVLEDVSSRGFRNAPRSEFLNLEHCRFALKTLAKFHSSSILYEASKSIELEAPYNLGKAYPEMFKETIYTREPSSKAKEWFEYSLEGIFKLAELMPKETFNSEVFTKNLKEFTDQSIDLYESLEKYNGTMLHGDLWSNNFLFKYKEDSVEDCVLIDFQLLKYGPPALDVLHVLFCNTRKSFRDEHFEHLLDFYYKCLDECVFSLNLAEILPYEEYSKLCADLQCAIKLQCLCDRCVTFMPDDYLQEILTAGKESDMEKFLFEDRAKAIVYSFKLGGLFKELIAEDMLELQDLLLKRSNV